MEIKNGALKITVDGSDKTIPIPAEALEAGGTVRAWRVPTKYVADGIFVSFASPGSAESYPACAGSDITYIGEIKMAPSPAFLLAGRKDEKRAEINAACNAAVASLAASYPEREVLSWPQQVKEAEALAINTKASSPLLSAIASERAVPLAVLAGKVLEKMSAYAAVSGAAIGRRQKIEALIDAAKTMDEVAAIAW